MARQAEQKELLLHFLVFIYDMPAAAAAKWLQSCPTLCDPVDGSPPGSTVPGILQARTCLELSFTLFVVFFFNSDQILCSIKWRRHGMGLEQGAHILSMITLF